MPNPVLLSSLYGELTRNVQARFDAASKLNKEIFDKVIYRQFLDWDTPTVSLDFEELIGKYNITVAAATIGEHSKEPIIGSNGIDTVKERVLNHAITRPMTMQDYRKILQLLDSKSISDEQKKKELINLMWGDVTWVVNGVEAKLDIIFLSALSNCGVFKFDENNNPEGGVRGEINFNQPSTNIAQSTTKWTEGNLETVDCMEDIQAILDLAEDRTNLGKVLCAPSRISYMCRSKKMKQMIWGTDKSSKIVQLKDINEYMESNAYPIFEKMKRQVRIHKGGNSFETLSPWNANNIVFIPTGKLGMVKNAYSDNELNPESDVAYSNYGRIRVSQWHVGETKGANKGEFTKAESLSLPVITEMENIYTLKTDY
jgi:hypothetical protein